MLSSIFLIGVLKLSRILSDKEIEYTLVSPEESDLSKGLISISSPIGRSLLGHEEGAEIQIVTPSGRKDYEIRSLTTIHDLE